MVEPIFAKSDFSIIRGQAKIYEHYTTVSGKKVYVHFCENCGTKLCLTFERFEDAVGVYGGTFDAPDWFERTPENSKHIFLSVAQRGTIIPPGINTFEEHATTTEGDPIEPHVYSEPMAIRP